MAITSNIFGSLESIKNLGQFLWRRKLLWMIPMIMILLLFAVIVVFAESGVAPFIYPLI